MRYKRMKELKAICILMIGVCLCFAAKGQEEQSDKSQLVLNAQTISWQDSLHANELKLKDLGDTVVDGITQTRRIRALKKFIPLLVKTLKFPGSFDYPFDSLPFLKILQPEDHSFRLLNWALKYNDGSYRYYGA